MRRNRVVETCMIHHSADDHRTKLLNAEPLYLHSDAAASALIINVIVVNIILSIIYLFEHRHNRKTTQINSEIVTNRTPRQENLH